MDDNGTVCPFLNVDEHCLYNFTNMCSNMCFVQLRDCQCISIYLSVCRFGWLASRWSVMCAPCTVVVTFVS